MARPKPRIDIIKRLGNAVVFGIDDRRAIEAKYGHKLTSKHWEQITRVTSLLMELIPGIKDATRLSTVLSKFKKLEAAAKSLRSEFNEIQDSGNFTPQEIYWAFFAPRRHCPRPSENFLFLDEILGAVIKFSEFAIEQIQKPDPEHPKWLAFSEGEVWNMWVNALTKIMENNGLDTKVRKDSYLNKKGSPSSFVTLVKELQKHLPEECRKFMHSDDALAQGIYRARHSK